MYQLTRFKSSFLCGLTFIISLFQKHELLESILEMRYITLGVKKFSSTVACKFAWPIKQQIVNERCTVRHSTKTQIVTCEGAVANVERRSASAPSLITRADEVAPSLR